MPIRWFGRSSSAERDRERGSGAKAQPRRFRKQSIPATASSEDSRAPVQPEPDPGPAYAPASAYGGARSVHPEEDLSREAGPQWQYIYPGDTYGHKHPGPHPHGQPNFARAPPPQGYAHGNGGHAHGNGGRANGNGGYANGNGAPPHAPPASGHGHAGANGQSPQVDDHKGHGHAHLGALQPSMPAKLVPAFQYSRCTGKHKALCVGINYEGQPNELKGCVNDAKNVRKFLIRHCKFQNEDVILLVDDTNDPNMQPTKANMIAGMQWLVKDAKAHDSLFFHYSGHGGQTKDLDGDEIDGKDETIFPVDFRKKGHMVDDQLHQLLVSPLPQGCRLTAIFDSCHSGTVLDLLYGYHHTGRRQGNQTTRSHRKEKESKADVIAWSGCKDDQTSADTTADGVSVGAMSHAFIAELLKNPQMSYIDLLRGVREHLRKYKQQPQLSSSLRRNMHDRFLI